MDEWAKIPLWLCETDQYLQTVVITLKSGISCFFLIWALNPVFIST